jgi:hypothetical protein
MARLIILAALNSENEERHRSASTEHKSVCSGARWSIATGEENGSPPIPGNVDKIREILSAAKCETTTRGFPAEGASLKSLLICARKRKDSSKVWRTVKKRSALAARLQAEQQSRETSVESVSRELRESGRLDVRVQQSVERATGQRAICASTSISQESTEEMRQKHEDLSGPSTGTLQNSVSKRLIALRLRC